MPVYFGDDTKKCSRCGASASIFALSFGPFEMPYEAMMNYGEYDTHIEYNICHECLFRAVGIYPMKIVKLEREENERQNETEFEVEELGRDIRIRAARPRGRVRPHLGDRPEVATNVR